MSLQNDNKIMELKAKVAEKKKALKKASKKFSPITNCLIGLDGTTFNINVCTADQLTMILIKLNSYKLSADDLGVSVPEIQGFSIEDWMTDVRARLDNLNVQSIKKELDTAEKQLDALLSDDKKTELAIADLEKLLS